MLATIIVTSVMVINLRHRVAETEGKNKLMEHHIAALQSANQSLFDSYNTMRELRGIDSEHLAELGAGLTEQGVKHERMRTLLDQLENDNASVRQLLETRLPPGIAGCMLDDSCTSDTDKNGVRDPSKTAAGSVR